MATLLVASLEETLSMTAFGDADPFRILFGDDPFRGRTENTLMRMACLQAFSPVVANRFGRK
jgi:hypothetical protein